MKLQRSAVLLILPTAIALLGLFVAPMLWILCQTLATDGLQYFIKFLTDPFYLDILWTTLRVALKVTVLALVLGYPTAYFMARTQSKMKNTLMIILIFPFLVSAVVRAYGWMVILGNKGLLNQMLLGVNLLDKPMKILYTETSVIIGLLHLLLPYMILSITGVIQGIDKNMEYAAYSLGGNPLQTFLRVIFPLSAPGVIAGSILTFTLSMTAYVTPKLLGGSKFRMMSTMVFQEVNVNFNWGMASAISYILLFVILLVLLGINLSTAGVQKRVGGAKNA